MRTLDEVQTALISYLKSQTSLTSLLGTDGQIKESQWQGADFIYPAIRLGNDIIPNMIDCPPDNIEGAISVFTEEKSSKRCSQIASQVATILHRLQFNSAVNDVKFVRIIVTRVTYPKQMEGLSIWESQVQISSLVS